jgi:hypothetical protein
MVAPAPSSVPASLWWCRAPAASSPGCWPSCTASIGASPLLPAPAAASQWLRVAPSQVPAPSPDLLARRRWPAATPCSSSAGSLLPLVSACAVHAGVSWIAPPCRRPAISAPPPTGEGSSVAATARAAGDSACESLRAACTGGRMCCWGAGSWSCLKIVPANPAARRTTISGGRVSQHIRHVPLPATRRLYLLMLPRAHLLAASMPASPALLCWPLRCQCQIQLASVPQRLSVFFNCEYNSAGCDYDSLQPQQPQADVPLLCTAAVPGGK